MNRLARLEREARTLAGLSHPNIVTIFSLEDSDGTLFLAMELVEGEGLETQVVPGGLPVARVVELGIFLAEALRSLGAVGDRPEIARVHGEMGWTALAAGNPAAARRAFRRAVVAHEEVGSPRCTGNALDGLVSSASTLTPAAVLAMLDAE